MPRILLITFAFVCISSFASEQAIEFPKVKSNVPYAQVAKLGFLNADHKVSYGAAPSQYALFWKGHKTPNQEQKPVVILIHGGCWLSAYDIKHTYALSTGLAQSGYDVWSLEYRRTGETGGGWPATFDDIKSGIKALENHQQGRFLLDNAVLVGHSAGGHLALLAGAKFSQVRGVIGLAAITDIEEYAQGTNSCQKVTEDFMGASASEKPVAYQAANPAKQPLHASTYLLTGSEDQIVPNSQLNRLKINHIELQGAGHFDWIHPGSPAFQTLLTQLKSISTP